MHIPIGILYDIPIGIVSKTRIRNTRNNMYVLGNNQENLHIVIFL